MDHHTEHHDQPDHESHEHVVGRFAQHRFIIMILGSVAIAFLLVLISMQLYSSSGTAQLDLSRPGYKSVRDQIKPDEAFDGFSASGPINVSALDNFKQLFDKRAKDATSVDAFSGDLLNDQTLGLDAQAEPTE